MVQKLSALVIILSLTLSWTTPIFKPSFAAAPTGVILSEVKLGGVISGQPTEFVELYNNGNQGINFDAGDWWLEYAKPAAQISDCSITSWSGQDSSSNVRNIRVTGMIAAKGYAVIEVALNDNSGGSLRLQHSGIIDDLVGWGTAGTLPSCVKGSAAVLPANGKSIQRLLDTSNQPMNTGNNSLDYGMPAAPTPGGPSVAQLPEPDPEPEPAPSPTPNCQGISINEILPNPAGDDNGQEFIELHNETSSSVDLTGCILKVGTAQQVLSGVIAANTYRAFYGLTLPNSAGGEVQFVTNTTSIRVTYPANLGDNEAYGFVDGAWQAGLWPSPNTANLATAATGAEPDSEAASPEPCAPGKYRNPDTKRCRNIEAESSLTPCGPGQVRNPDTNRCRNAVTATSGLTACKPGETRNPDTNRCRKNSASGSTLAACKEGQARNPETNRCRNVASAKSINSMAQSAKAGSKPVSYYVLGIVAALAVGYGAWEYRNSIGNFFRGQFAKLRKEA